jgi:hypothetical protein
VLGYLGTEEMARGELDEAEGYFRRYLDEKTGWDEERAQVHRKLAQVLMAQGRTGDAGATRRRSRSRSRRCGCCRPGPTRT